MPPIYTNLAGSDEPAPLESTPVGTQEGRLAAISAGYQRSPAVTMIQAAVAQTRGGPMVSHDDAVKRMTDQGYDASHIPAEGLTDGALGDIMNRQSILKRDTYAMSRAGTGGVAQFVGGMIGGAIDPINLATIALAPEAKIGQGFLTKAAIGAGVQGAVAAGVGLASMPATHYMGDDYKMSDVFPSVAMQALIGGLTHGFAKGVPLPDRLTTDNVVALEGSHAFAANHNKLNPNAPISADEVVSHTGAVGLHQVEPKTARGLGLKGTDAEITQQLKDPAVNKATSQKLLDQLAKQFKGDPEAQAIAYNAGPKRAQEWIKAGRNDSVLPRETQGYVARYREQTGGTVGSPNAPVVAYHGTNADFVNHDLKLGGQFGAKDARLAAFFTDHPGVAEGYGDFASLGANRGEGVNIRPVQIDMKNPRVVDWEGEMYSATKFKTILQEAKAAGHDGVVFKNVQDDVSGKSQASTIYASFDPDKATKPYFGKQHPVHDLPPSIQPEVLKTALAQAGEDSKVNVEPVVKQSMAEHWGVKGGSDFDPYNGAVPKPGDAEHVPLDERLKPGGDLAKFAPTPSGQSQTKEGPRTTEATKLLADDTAELQRVPAEIRKTEEPQTVAADNAIKQTEDIHKATEAAVQCALNRGTE
jgi:hypothetical protein